MLQRQKKLLLISNGFSICLGGGGNTKVLFQTRPPSPIAQKTFRMKRALQRCPVPMFPERWKSFGWMAAAQPSAERSASLATLSAASGSCHLAVTGPPCRVPSATQTALSAFFSWKQTSKKHHSILSKAQRPSLLISALDPPVSFVFHLQTTHQPLEDCRWYPWLGWKKMPKACVNILNLSARSSWLCLGLEARGDAVIKQQNRGPLHTSSSHSLPFLHLPRSSYSCQQSMHCLEALEDVSEKINVSK